MTVNASESVIGPAYITWRSTEMGLTTTDGCKIRTEFSNVELEPDQSIVVEKINRTRVKKYVEATFLQLTQAAVRLLEDNVTAIAAGVRTEDFSSTPTSGTLVVTHPGASGSTRVRTYTAVVITPGEEVFSNGEYTGKPVVFQILGDSDTNSYGTEVETATSATAPAVASYQKIENPWTSESTITDGATAVALTAYLQVTFGVDVRPDMLNSGKIILKENDGNTLVAHTQSYGTTTGATDYTKVKIVPTAALTTATEYEIIVAPGIYSVSGVKGTVGAAMQFTTA